jgi:hypothetical protein
MRSGRLDMKKFNTRRYVEMLAAKQTPFVLQDGQLFARQRQWVAPVGPAAQPFDLSPSQARRVQATLGGWWVSWTEGLDAKSDASKWHAVVCRRHKTVAEIPSPNTRSKIRRALKNCEARRVDAAEIARNGYDTFVAALRSYSPVAQIPSPEQFANRVLTDAPFDDIKHHWAVYLEGKLVGFAQCHIYDRIEADYTLLKFHPSYLNRYVSYALIFAMNQYYLEQERFEYVNDGWRSVLHETGIQDFLVREFDFERVGASLRVEFRQPLAALLQCSAPFHRMLNGLDKRLAAVLELCRMRSLPEPG